MTENQRQCADCRAGEHENYDDDIMLTVIKDPDNGKLVKRAFLCWEHREAYAWDGYTLY